MADSRFFSVVGPFSLGDLAATAGATLAAGTDPLALVSDVAPLDVAGPGEISFLDNRKYAAQFEASKAGACIVRAEMVERAPAGMALLLSDDPYRTYAHVAQKFHPQPVPEPWVAPTAWVAPDAVVDASCRLEPGAVVLARAEVAAGCWIGANAVIGAGVIVGEGCVIGANVTISHAVIGRRVSVYPGVRIGQDGFGFAMGPQGHLKVPQLGRVVIGDGVEIGANTTIDRGAGPDTVIGDGCMIDNLVQIAHNVQMGRGCVIAGQVGISGSTHMGDFVAIGGQAGLTGHLRIGSGARIAAQSGVMRDIPAGGTVGGSPAVPMADWLRQSAALGRLARRKG